MAEDSCSHLNAITKVKRPTRRECEECVKIGASWVHLRTCQTCGVTLCCDDSPNRHATKHAHASGHPVIASAEPGERAGLRDDPTAIAESFSLSDSSPQRFHLLSLLKWSDLTAR